MINGVMYWSINSTKEKYENMIVVYYFVCLLIKLIYFFFSSKHIQVIGGIFNEEGGVFKS